MSHYNFNLIGNVMSFKSKITKHIESENCDRIKDYICSAYDGVDPSKPKDHPCYDDLYEGIKILRKYGWKIYIGSWKEVGSQIIILSPDHNYYHSHFNHI